MELDNLFLHTRRLKFGGFGESDWWVECFPYKHEALSSVPRTCVESQCGDVYL